MLRGIASFGIVMAPAALLAILPLTGWLTQEQARLATYGAVIWFVGSLVALGALAIHNALTTRRLNRITLQPRSRPGFQVHFPYAAVDVHIPGAVARTCRSRVVSITPLTPGDHHVHPLDIALRWDSPDSPDDPAVKTFVGRARLTVSHGGTLKSAVPLGGWDLRMSTFAESTDYRIALEVMADGLPVAIGWFRFRWESNYKYGASVMEFEPVKAPKHWIDDSHTVDAHGH